MFALLASTRLLILPTATPLLLPLFGIPRLLRWHVQFPSPGDDCLALCGSRSTFRWLFTSPPSAQECALVTTARAPSHLMMADPKCHLHLLRNCKHNLLLFSNPRYQWGLPILPSAASSTEALYSVRLDEQQGIHSKPTTYNVSLTRNSSAPSADDG